MAYAPKIQEYCDLLRDYALGGLAYYMTLDGKMQSRVNASLANKIEGNEVQLDRKFSATKKGNVVDFNFIPMPKPSGKDFKIAFFVPRFSHEPNGEFNCAFCILLWIDLGTRVPGAKTISFRLELADADSSSHAYSHLQLSPDVRKPYLPTSFSEKWMPAHYPAFPIGPSTPIGFFVTVATSIHGYSKQEKNRYLPSTLRSAMSEGAAALRAHKLLSEIDLLLA